MAGVSFLGSAMQLSGCPGGMTAKAAAAMSVSALPSQNNCCARSGAHVYHAGVGHFNSLPARHVATATVLAGDRLEITGAAAPLVVPSSSSSLIGRRVRGSSSTGRTNRSIWGGRTVRPDVANGMSPRIRVVTAAMDHTESDDRSSRGTPPKAISRSPSSSSSSSSSVSRKQAAATLHEQNQRLLSMQKELLEQIEERKKLHAALLDSLDESSSRVKSLSAASSGHALQVPKSNGGGMKVGGGAVQLGGRDRFMPKLESSATSIEADQPLINKATPPQLSLKSSPPKISSDSAERSSQSWDAYTSSSSPSTSPSAAEQAYRDRHTPASVFVFDGSSTSQPQEVVEEASPRWPTALEPNPLRTSDKSDKRSLSEVISAAIETVEEPEEPLEVEKPPPLAGPNVMNVIIVAAECAPWSKTGGLGDVVGALPKALARRGHRVMVVAPRYKNYDDAWDTTVRKRYNVNGQDMEVGYFHGYVDGVDYVFVDHGVFMHCGDNIYGGSREELMKRCVLLCKAAVEAAWHVPCGGVAYGDSNLVFVANDWHTAMLPVYLQAYYRDHGQMQYARAALVIHNMAHQGRSGVAYFKELGLPDHYLDVFKLYDPVGGEHMNVLMAGIKTAHRLVAVSHGYAWECQTEDGGWGLHNVVRENAWKLRGVVNGIDEKEWDPAVDKFLTSDGYCHYNIETLETGKEQCKAALQREFGLPVNPKVPLMGFIGRLDYQKGVDLIQQAKPWMMGQDVQLVMLGTGREDLENMLRAMENEHRDKCRGWVGFSVKMAHRITAGCDILLMPSRFEPCGLNQLYAMRYGTVPVVHAVGGLRDTVQPFDPFTNAGLGWTFERADSQGLIHALGNALVTYNEYRTSFRDIQRRGMAQDLSWDNAAAQYEEVLVAAKYQW